MSPSDDDRRAIAAVREALETAENAGDAAAAASLLADDAVLMVPDYPVQEGNAACAAFLHDVMGWLAAHVRRRITYVSDEVVVLGEVAFDRGTFAFTVAPRSGGIPERVTGKYLWLLARTSDGSWRVSRLIACRDEGGEGQSADRGVAVSAEDM